MQELDHVGVLHTLCVLINVQTVLQIFNSYCTVQDGVFLELILIRLKPASRKLVVLTTQDLVVLGHTDCIARFQDRGSLKRNAETVEREITI